MQTGACAKKLEESCRRGERDKIPSLVKALNAASATSSRAIEARMNAGAPDPDPLKLSA
jgi:hypothetical protein